MSYPENWPRCPGCGEPALDGHITCGDSACGSESGWREELGSHYVRHAEVAQRERRHDSNQEDQDERTN